MPFQNVTKYSLAAAAVGRELSANLWRNTLTAYANEPNYGVLYFEDFIEDRINASDASAELGWFMQNSVDGGTSNKFISVANKPDGVVSLEATTGTDVYGNGVHRGATATTSDLIHLPTHNAGGTTADPRGRVVYETLVDLHLVDQCFIGLTEPIVEFLVTSTGALPQNSDYIGFYRSDAGDLNFVCANDNAGGVAVTDSCRAIAAASIPTTAGVFTKLGFAVNRDNSVDISVNGVLIPRSVSSINPLALPIEGLTPAYEGQRGATANLATIKLLIDWVSTFVEAL
jgi:hypothetical protein